MLMDFLFMHTKTVFTTMSQLWRGTVGLPSNFGARIASLCSDIVGSRLPSVTLRCRRCDLPLCDLHPTRGGIDGQRAGFYPT
jgi:hypothetical protein